MHEQTLDLEAVQEKFKDHPGLLPQLLDLLKKELPLMTHDLKQAFKDNDAKALQTAAHKIRGASSYCGAQHLQEKAAKLENFLKDSIHFKKSAIIVKTYRQLLQEIQAVEKSLAIYFKA